MLLADWAAVDRESAQSALGTTQLPLYIASVLSIRFDMNARCNALLLVVLTATMQTLVQGYVRADQCTFTTREPNPPAALVRIIDRGDKEDYEQVCMVASFRAYLQIDQDKYLNYRMSGGSCQKSYSMKAKLRLEFDCGASVTLSMMRTRSYAWEIESATLDFFVSPPITIQKLLAGWGPHVIGHGYRCKSQQSIVLSDDPYGVGPVKLILSDVRIEAFRDQMNENGFYQPQDLCFQDGAGSSAGAIIFAVVIVLVVIGAAVYYVKVYRNSEESP